MSLKRSVRRRLLPCLTGLLAFLLCAGCAPPPQGAGGPSSPLPPAAISPLAPAAVDSPLDLPTAGALRTIDGADESLPAHQVWLFLPLVLLIVAAFIQTLRT